MNEQEMVELVEKVVTDWGETAPMCAGGFMVLRADVAGHPDMTDVEVKVANSELERRGCPVTLYPVSGVPPVRMSSVSSDGGSPRVEPGPLLVFRVDPL